MIHPIDHWRTLDDRSITMPWYTRPCLEWLDKLPLHTMNVFEYGCGVSSLWFQSRGCNLAGVDTKKEWLFLPLQQQWETKLDDYRLSILAYPHLWDIIVIDGDFRDDCTQIALQHLKPGGYLICDNFEQASADLADWPKTRELTKNLKVVGFFKEPDHEDWCSVVFQNQHG